MRARLTIQAIAAGIAMLLLQASPAAARQSFDLTIRQERAEIMRLVSAANGGHLAAVEASFAPSAVVRVGAHRWSGRKAVNGWWRQQIAHGLRITVRTTLLVQRGSAVAAIRRWTRGSDCSRGCAERATWHFSGGALDQMTLLPLLAPPPPRMPTVPPAPTGPPSPHVTPTAPS